MRDESLDLEHIMTADPDQIRRQIERTQQVLSADVNALAEKVSPRRAVARRTDRTRRTLTKVKEVIMGTARDAVSAVGDAATGAASTASDTARNAASTATDTASSVALATADRVSSIASSAADAVGSAPQAVRRRVQGKQLAAGLITFGAGWLAASVMKVSRQERKLLAEATDRRGECLEPWLSKLNRSLQTSQAMCASRLNWPSTRSRQPRAMRPPQSAIRPPQLPTKCVTGRVTRRETWQPEPTDSGCDPGKAAVAVRAGLAESRRLRGSVLQILVVPVPGSPR
jgi:Protein of unknown function (DUF3618)